MRKFRQFLMTLVLLGSALTSWAESEPYSGSPSLSLTKIDASNYTNYGFTAENWQAFENYYAITSAEDLYCFADSVNEGSEQWQSANAVLTDDIVVNLNVPADGNLNGATMHSWTPIGTKEKPFEGKFDGNSHTISGLYFGNITASNYPYGGNNVGLIGYADGATIKNVGVVDSYIKGNDYVGGICGYCFNSSTIITNCYNTGTVSATYYVGGICGYGGSQTNCYNTGTVSGSPYVGGICGYSGTQRNCYYLAGCAKDGKNVVQYGVGNGTSGQTTSDVAGRTTAATAEEFASGKITYLLNGSTSEGNLAWYQTIGTDALPVGNNTHDVVYATQPCPSFTNDPNSTHKDHSSDDVTGYCSACNQFAVQGTWVTKSNYSSLNLTADFVGYYAISSTAELYWFANEVNNGRTAIKAVLTADIVVNENVLNADGTLNGTPTYSWTPIGISTNYSDKCFKGTFDGNGHTISGLYFSNTTNKNYPDGGNYVGLIGYANGATIKNVGVIKSYISGKNYVGSICGEGYNSTNITNCYNAGTVSGTLDVGGICGYGYNTTITNSYNAGTVSGSSYNVGGVCGYGYNTTITNSHNTGTVSGSSNYVGGICGYGGTQTNCYNKGMVSGSSDYVGGICGYNGDQTNCYNTGTVSGSSYVGGICGKYGTQTNCYYLAGCGSKNTLGVSASAEEFKSGKITYLLNGSTSGGNIAWYQTLGDGNDAYPVLDNTHDVVYATQPCHSFSNDANNTHKEHSSMDKTGYCSDCGQFTVQGTLVTESNYNSLNLSADFIGYYAISNTAELYWFANEVNIGNATINAVLTKDIEVNTNVLNESGTLNGTPTYSWTPIGTEEKPFAGTFDGNSYAISGLYFNNSTNKNYPAGGNYVGLIGYADGATIKNVGVVDSYLRGYQYVGGICGKGGTQTNCYNTGTVSGSSYYVGGICGKGGTQTNCYNTGTVSGSNGNVGGICGTSGTITNCYNTGTVSATYYVGGICGSGGTLTNCYNTGTVSGSSYNVGGICGYNGDQTNCYYLAGCAKDGNNVVQYGVGNSTKGKTTADVTGKTISATTKEFTSGKVTYLLNGSTSEGDLVWFQTLGEDKQPLLDNTRGVVYASNPCPFNNNSSGIVEHNFINGICICGITEQPNSVDGVYQIANAGHLYWFADEVNNGNTTINAVLTADIVVNENVLNADGSFNGTPTYSWTPIGTEEKPFAGTFDGNSYAISGLYFNNSTNKNYPAGGNYVGLIGYADGATIKNVGVIKSYLRGNRCVGGICGYCTNRNTTITNCYNTGTVSGSSNNVGGICGYNGDQTNCYNTGIVNGSSNRVGGICGSDGDQTNCYYLEGCAKDGNNVVQYGVGNVTTGQTTADVAGRRISATAEEFANGKITYRLNGSTSEGNLTWYQTIGTDALPVGDNTHDVVYATLQCTGGFSNTEGVIKEHSSMDATGRCTACGQFIAQGTLVTENNRDSLNLSADFVGYYAISKSADLYWFADEVNNGNTTINAVLTADIVVNKNVLKADGTLNGTPTYSWTPIGTSSKKYAGTFDGNGHTISGLYFRNTNSGAGGEYVGLIGYANGATIKNVGVIDSYIFGLRYVGGICGVLGTQTNCYNTGTVKCYDRYVGGICGYNGTQTNCYNTGTVSSPSSYYIGGICGYYGTQTNCYNTGTVSGSGNIGGICGYQGTQTNCYNTGMVSGSSGNVGGICGYNGTQTNCYNTGTVSGTDYVGGICGANGTQTNCYNRGTVSGSNIFVGGICGYKGAQTNCYNTGAVSGTSYYSSYVGGICGREGTQTNCYYLAGCAKDGNSVVQYGVGNETTGQTTADVAGKTTATTTEEFASGKIGYLLNNDNNNAWYQDLYSDEYPLLDNTHNLASGYIEVDDATYTVVGNMYLAENYEIVEGKTLNVPAGSSLTTTGSAIITNNGTIIANGSIAGNNLAGNGSFVYNTLGANDVALVKTSFIYKGAAFTLSDDLQASISTRTFCGKTFTFDGSETSVSYENNRNVGDNAKVTWTNANGSSVSKTFSIMPKTLTISNIVAASKTYDGNPTTTVSYTADVFSGDNVTFGTAAVFENENAGTGKTVSFNYTKSGDQANNYTFAKDRDETTANITPKAIEISNIAASGKTYDGNTTATITYSKAGILEGDAVTVSHTAAFADKNVGDAKQVSFNFTKTGTDAANYEFDIEECTPTANITARELTLSNFTAADKTYDGTTTVGINSFSDDRVEGDKLEFSYDIAFANANVVEGGNSVNFSNIAISGGADKDNYSLVTLSGSAAANITPVTDEVVVTVTLADKTVTYNGAEQTYSATAARTVFAADNALYNVNENVAESGNAQNVSGTNAGEYAFGWTEQMFSNTSANFSNVKFSVTDGKLVIGPMTGVVVTITENSNTVVYNTNEQTVSGYTVAVNTELYTESDFTFSGTAIANGTTVGDYAMNLSTTDFENTNNNFAGVEFVIVDGALTIAKAPEAPNKPAATMETRYIVTQLVALPENWKWADEQQALEEGDNTATANYDGADKGNYEVESVDVTIKRLPCLHDQGNDVLYKLEPTCTHKGYEGNLSCKLCGKIYQQGDSIPALGHAFDTVAFAPTCTAEGYKELTCSRCNHVEHIDIVPANGHTADSVVFENIVEATCTEAGSKDSVVYCSVCHIELSRDAIVIPAAGHKADSVVFENIVEATRTAAGSYDSVVYCSVCKVELSRTTVEVPQILAETIKLASAPTKVEYLKGEQLDVTGGKISVGYSDNTTDELDMLAEWVSGFDSEKIGTQQLMVTFESVSSTLTTTFDVTVKEEENNQGGNENQGGNNEGGEGNEEQTTIVESDAPVVNIYAYGNTIVVENATDEIRVYNAMGALVCRDAVRHICTKININITGVYIVKTGRTVKRVMVE